MHFHETIDKWFENDIVVGLAPLLCITLRKFAFVVAHVQTLHLVAFLLYVAYQDGLRASAVIV